MRIDNDGPFFTCHKCGNGFRNFGGWDYIEPMRLLRYEIESWWLGHSADIAKFYGFRSCHGCEDFFWGLHERSLQFRYSRICFIGRENGASLSYILRSCMRRNKFALRCWIREELGIKL